MAYFTWIYIYIYRPYCFIHSTLAIHYYAETINSKGLARNERILMHFTILIILTGLMEITYVTDLTFTCLSYQIIMLNMQSICPCFFMFIP
jgi:hypothetical protein